jgi:hypothetical protein
MLSNIPLNRLILYAMLLGVIPFILVAFHFMGQKSQLSSLEQSIGYLKEKAYIQEKKQAVNIAVRNHYRDADHFYIDKYLETLDFLEPEVESLQKVMNNKNFADDENIKKRFEFLTGNENNLTFTEGVVQSNPLFQETTETLVHPVEIDAKDLRTILAKIEGTQIGEEIPSPNRPQLIILDFKLERKNAADKNEVFLLNLKLLKREFL